MAFSWRLSVLGANGVAKPPLDTGSAVAGLESFSSDGSGSCGEATFTALPGMVDIEPRDVITLATFDDGIGYSVYRGVIVSAGTSRASRLQQYRAVGLKQRAYEAIITTARINGGDVGTVAEAVLGNIWGPMGMVGIVPPVMPYAQFAFEVGDRYPRLETVGDFMDALVATVGPFVVPTGETYTYDGVTWTAGQTVPGAVWGVGPTGFPFCHRPIGAPREFYETNRDTRVMWRPREAERVSDRVVLIYASAPTEGTEAQASGATEREAAFVPLYLAVGSGTLNAARKVVLENPIDYMTEATLETGSQGSIANLANAFDANSTTFAEFTGLPPGVILAQAAVESAIIELDVMTSGAERSTDANIIIVVGPMSGEVMINPARFHYPVEDTDQRMTVYLTVLRPADSTTISHVQVNVFGGEGVRVYGLRMWVPDLAVAERLRQAFVQPIRDEVGYIVQQTPMVPTHAVTDPRYHRPQASVSLEGGEVVESPIERIETSVTTERGLAVTYHFGQAFEPDLEAQRVVLERLAERQVQRALRSVP